MRVLLVAATAAIIFYGIAADNWAADPEVKFNLLTLPSVRVAAEQLEAPARVFGDRITLRTSVVQLAEVYQFSYWIDRQVDADKPLTLPLPDASQGETTLGECLWQLAQGSEAEVGLVENVVTIAAPARLAAMQYVAVRLHDQLSRSAPGAANANAALLNSANAAQLRPLDWPMLTTPTGLYQKIGRSWGFRGAVELPHDLMNAGRLHPCTAATQLTLLLGGFDRCSVGRQLSELRIAPMPAAGPWQATYSGLPEANIAAVVAKFPAAKLVRSGKQVVFAGTTAAHLDLLYRRSPRASTASVASKHNASRPAQRSSAQRPGSQRPGSQRPGSQRQPAQSTPGQRPENQSQPASAKEAALLRQRYTIRQDQPQPLRSVMTTLSQQLGLEVQWSEMLAPVATEKGVTLDVKDARLDDVFDDLAAQAGVSITRDGLVVHVAPPGKEKSAKGF